MGVNLKSHATNSLIGNTFEGDIHKLAEPLLSMDYKSAGRAQGGAQVAWANKTLLEFLLVTAI